MTHVALVADAAESQSLLPQVFLVNQHMVSVGACQSEPNSSIYIWREPTAWSSSSMMIRIIDILYDHLPHVLEGYQPILILDCATPHLPSSVLEAATRLGFWVVFAPARITWLVQPLDVFVFRNYKRCLQKAHRRLISGAPGGVVTNALWLSQLTKTASEFLSHRNWHDAFVQTGATGSQTTLTKALESFNGLPSPQLTASNLRALFPRNRQVDLNSLFNPVLQAVQAHLRARQ